MPRIVTRNRLAIALGSRSASSSPLRWPSSIAACSASSMRSNTPRTIAAAAWSCARARPPLFHRQAAAPLQVGRSRVPQGVRAPAAAPCPHGSRPAQEAGEPGHPLIAVAPERLLEQRVLVLERVVEAALPIPSALHEARPASWLRTPGARTRPSRSPNRRTSGSNFLGLPMSGP